MSSVDERLRPGGGRGRPGRSVQPFAGPPPAYDGWDDDPEASPYAVRPVRPVAQLAARVGLWALVGLGGLGGMVALVRPFGSDTAVDMPAAEEAVPAPVVRVAEMVVEEWLTATGDDRDRLDALFVEPPPPGDVGEGLAVDRVTSLAGRQVAEGYWAVTVAADVVETPVPGGLVDDGERGDGAASTTPTTIPDGEPQPTRTRWYVEVGIVGDVEQGLAALTTPAVMPLPPTLPADAHNLGVSPGDAPPGDPITQVVEGFLRAMLTGDGDPTRYLAPGVSMTAADPPPFVDVRVEQVFSEPLGEDTEIWILASIVATTPGGVERGFTYDLYAAAAVDRWEIVALSGVPTRTVRPVTDAEAGA